MIEWQTCKWIPPLQKPASWLITCYQTESLFEVEQGSTMKPVWVPWAQRRTTGTSFNYGNNNIFACRVAIWAVVFAPRLSLTAMNIRLINRSATCWVCRNDNYLNTVICVWEELSKMALRFSDGDDALYELSPRISSLLNNISWAARLCILRLGTFLIQRVATYATCCRFPCVRLRQYIARGTYP